MCLFHVSMPRWLEFGGMYLLSITWFIEFLTEKRWTTKPSREWIFYGLLIVIFLWAFLYFPWDGQVYFHRHLEQRLPLIGFGLAGMFGINSRHSRALVINTMILVSVSSVLFLIFKTGWHDALFSPNRITLVSQCRIEYINAHMGYNFFLNSTLIGIWYLLFHADRKPRLWQKITYPIAVVIIFYALLCSDGRSGFFMGVALLGMMMIIELYRLNKWAGLGSSVIALTAVILLSAMHPRITMESLTNDLRYSYWKSAGELIAQKPIFGYGMSKAQEEFDQVNMKYASTWQKHYWTVVHHHFIDCHNQYIQTMLEFGVIGLIILLAIYLSPMVICSGKREWWLAFFFTLISMGQSIFDMFLTGRFNMIYCILMLMTISMQDYSSPAPQTASATDREACTD